jgi:hypothetical protein
MPTRYNVVDPDPIGSAFFSRIRIRMNFMYPCKASVYFFQKFLMYCSKYE